MPDKYFEAAVKSIIGDPNTSITWINIHKIVESVYEKAIELKNVDDKKIIDALKAAKNFIDCHVTDPDYNAEMYKNYLAYKEAIKVLPDSLLTELLTNGSNSNV